MHHQFVCECVDLICYSEQNGCGKKNTGEVTPETRKRLIKVSTQTLCHVSNPFPCKSFNWRQVTLPVWGRISYVTKGFQG